MGSPDQINLIGYRIWSPLNERAILIGVEIGRTRRMDGAGAASVVKGWARLLCPGLRWL
jgi:hypothetical protein